MIRRLVLKNWRSHEDSEFIFSRGTNVLIGRMGSGKTSTMDAISFALFGTFSNLQSRKLKLDDCIMSKPNQKDKARVELELELNGDIYTIIREITRGKGTTHAEIRKNGKLIEGGNANRVNEIVEEIVGINYDLFSKAIYSEQNQIDYFLQIPRGKRRQKIDELLGIDKFEEARKNLVSIRNRLKDRIADREEELERLKKDNLEEKLKTLEEEAKSLEREISEISQTLGRLEKEYSHVKETLEELERVKEKLEKLKNEENAISGKLMALKERIATYEEKYAKFLGVDLKPKLDSVLKKLESLSKTRQDLLKQISELDSQVSDLKGKLKRLEDIEEEKEKMSGELAKVVRELSSYSDVSQELEKTRREIEEVKNALARARASLKNLEDREKQLGKAEGECPVCGRPLEEHKKAELTTHVKEEIERTRSQIAELEGKLSKLEPIKAELEKRYQKLAVLQGKKEELEKRLLQLKEIKDSPEELKLKIAELLKRREELNKRAVDLEPERDRLLTLKSKLERLMEIQEDYSKSKRELGKLEEKLEELKKERESLKFDNKAYLQTREKVINLASSISSLKSELSGKKTLLEEKKKLAKEIKAGISRKEEIEKEITTFKTILKDIGILVSALETGQVLLREEFVAAVNSALEDIWPRLYPYEDYKSLRLAIDDKDYLLQLQRRDGKWVNVEGIASGGERSTAALALRVAFALVLTQNLSWLILDEPTHNLDREGVLMLARTLKEHLPTLVDQIFIITHDENMEEAVSGTLYKLERDKGLDEPTRVVMVSSGET